MTNKFSKKSFGRSAIETTNGMQGPTIHKGAWTRDNRNNKLFAELQVKDISTITDENTIAVWDHDGIPFKSAGMVEDDYIVAIEVDPALTKKNNDGEFEYTMIEGGVTREAKNVTEFWGVGKEVASNSWVGIQNIDREIEGLPLWTKDSFSIDNKKRLKTKFINSKTGERFKNPKRDENGIIIEGTGDDPLLKLKVEQDLSDVVEIMEMRIKEVREQWGIKNFLMCLGQGKVFRDELPLPQPYKGQRSSLRPILLKEARQYILDNYNSEMAPEGVECDDLTEFYAAKGYASYKKTGVFSHIMIAEDKDALSNPKLLINYGRAEGGFKYPQATLIEDSSVSVGTLELRQMSKKTEVKGTGLVWLTAQAFGIGDSADFYSPYSKFPKEMKKHIKHGDVAFYKQYSGLTTPREVLQQAVDNMFEWWPKGLQYTDCHGVEQDIDTFTWMEVCFSVAYMLRSLKDKTTFKKLCDHFKVDYSKVVDNNIEKVLPFLPEESLRLALKDNTSEVDNIIALLNDKSGKVADKNKRKELAVSLLEDLKTFDGLDIIDNISVYETIYRHNVTLCKQARLL